MQDPNASWAAGFSGIDVWSIDPFAQATTDSFKVSVDRLAIRGVPEPHGGALALALVLYPYVYLLARGAFITHGLRQLEVGRSLGMSDTRIFLTAVLPSCWPWIAGGLLLVFMETLADFGTVAVFNYDTFTTAIYKSWFDLYSLETGLALSAFLVLAVIAILSVDGWYRSKRSFAESDALTQKVVTPERLGGFAGWLAFSFCMLLLTAGFLLPVLQLIQWSMSVSGGIDGANAVRLALDSARLAAFAGTLITLLAFSLAIARRFARTRLAEWLLRITTLGYALPGTVLAIALFSGASLLHSPLSTLGISVAWLQGSLFVMMLAYSVRFLAVALQPISANLERITPAMDDVGTSLGASWQRRVLAIYTPLLRTGILTALLLAFVDVLKELPITLMTRPFGTNTLAVKIYEYSAEGLWEQAAVPALIILSVSLIPVVFIIRFSEGRANEK